MDYEQLITEVGIQPLQLFLGLAMGLAFGIGASISQFCLRKLVLDLSVLKLSNASYTWLFGLGVAIMATQLLLRGDTGDISEAPVLNGGASLSGPIIGGFMFGFGMILSRGCASRQIIQLASGNLRSLFTLATFAVAAQLTYGGQLVPFRQTVQDLWRLNQPANQLHEWLPLAQSHYLIIGVVMTIVSALILIKGRACPFVIQTALIRKMTFHQRLQGNLLPDHCQDLMI